MAPRVLTWSKNAALVRDSLNDGLTRLAVSRP